jgi:hypothetical protein
MCWKRSDCSVIWSCLVKNCCRLCWPASGISASFKASRPPPAESRISVRFLCNSSLCRSGTVYWPAVVEIRNRPAAVLPETYTEIAHYSRESPG